MIVVYVVRHSEGEVKRVRNPRGYRWREEMREVRAILPVAIVIGNSEIAISTRRLPDVYTRNTS